MTHIDVATDEVGTIDAMATRPLSFDPISEAARQWSVCGWSDAAPGMAAVTSIMRASQLLLQRVDEVLRPFSLTFARYEVLTLLSFTRTGALPLGKLGDRLQVHPASVTNAVDRLESAGLVSRVPNPRDGRGTLARLTPKGRRLVARVTPLLNESVFAHVGLEQSDLDALFRILQKLRAHSGDFA